MFPTGDRREGVRCALSKMLDRRIVGDVFWIACAGPVSRKPCCCRRDGNQTTRLKPGYFKNMFSRAEQTLAPSLDLDAASGTHTA